MVENKAQETNEILKEVKVKVYHKQTKDGKKFDTYRAVQKDGKLIDCKFRKDVKVLPTEDCIIVVKVKNMNISYSKEYPALWMAEIEDIKPIEKLSKQNLNDLF